MAIKRTPYRIIYPLRELEVLHKLKRDALPDCMEILPNGTDVGIYLTREEFIARQGEIFPRCPVTGAFCTWDSDYIEESELL